MNIKLHKSREFLGKLSNFQIFNNLMLCVTVQLWCCNSDARNIERYESQCTLNCP
jgi:small nuclear ribonucleoprotein (snRNP)-like protein